MINNICCEYELNEYLMASACNPDEKNRLTHAYREINKNADDYGLISAEEAILSANTYYNISKLEKNVIDVGCHAGLQQVFFDKYIGIDLVNNFIKIKDDATFIQGDAIEILPKLKDYIKANNLVGISVLCGSVWPPVKQVMCEYFDKVIIV